MAGPPPPNFSEFVQPRQPSVRERQIQASTQSSQASAQSSQATAAEKEALLPARKRSAEANATIAETKAEQAKMALEKAKRLQSTLPPLDQLPEARDLLLKEIRNLVQAKELSRTMFGASGVGHTTTSLYSGSPAATVNNILRPVLSNAAFKALNKMKQESPTGGALGNVTEMELKLLMSSEGSVDPTGDDVSFQQGLDDMIEKRIRVLNRMGVDFGELAQALGPDNIEQFAPKIEAFRFRKEDEEGLDEYVKNSMANGTFDPTDFAALMGQAYYRATGNRPDDNWIQGAFESGTQILEDGRTDLGGFSYQTADEDARNAFMSYTGSVERPETSLGSALGGAALNFIPSTFELAADTVKALTLDLPDTIEGTAKVIAGATGLSDDDTAWEAVKDYYVDRYGSYDGFKRALREDPASIAADVAGLFTGGALIVGKAASTAGKVGKIAALSKAAQAAEGFGQVAARLDPLVTAGQVAKKGLEAGANAVKTSAVAVPAKLAGVTSADVAQAFDAGKRGSAAFTGQLEGTADVADPIAKAQAAVSELYKNRSRDYVNRMKRLKRDPEIVSFDDVDKAIEGVRKVGRHKGIDISGAGGVWDDVDAKVMEFFDAGLNTVEDFDAMKRAVGNIRDKHQKGTPEYKVANDVYKAINDTIVEKAPVYADVMRDYRMASDTLSDIQSSMSLGAKSGDTTLTKLRRSASGRAARGDTVLNMLESTKAGKGLGDMLAGQNLSSTEPSMVGSIAGPAATAATGSIGGMAASMMTPRSLGRGAYNLGEKYGVGERAAMALADLPPVRAGIDKASELAAKYGAGTMQGVRMANPLIQAQVDPLQDISEEAKQRLLREYIPTAPELLPSGSTYGSPRLEDMAVEYSGPMLPVDETGAPVAQEGGASMLQMDGRPVGFDPDTQQLIYTDTGEPVEGYAKGGKVEATWGDRARSVAKGATFAFNDEIEAGLRALAQLDPAAYQREVKRIRARQNAYEEAYPLESLGYEVGGAFVPALLPGAQGATGARLAQLAAKYPRASALGSAAAQGALYGAGDAQSMRDVPYSAAEGALLDSMMYGGAGLAAKYGKKAYRKVRGR